MSKEEYGSKFPQQEVIRVSPSTEHFPTLSTAVTSQNLELIKHYLLSTLAELKRQRIYEYQNKYSSWQRTIDGARMKPSFQDDSQRVTLFTKEFAMQLLYLDEVLKILEVDRKKVNVLSLAQSREIEAVCRSYYSDKTPPAAPDMYILEAEGDSIKVRALVELATTKKAYIHRKVEGSEQFIDDLRSNLRLKQAFLQEISKQLEEPFEKIEFPENIELVFLNARYISKNNTSVDSSKFEIKVIPTDFLEKVSDVLQKLINSIIETQQDSIFYAWYKEALVDYR